MKPPLFHPGQLVAATSSEFTTMPGFAGVYSTQQPVKGQVYTVALVRPYQGLWFLVLEGFALASDGTLVGFHEAKFTAVEELPAEVLAELLEEPIPA